MPSIPPQAMLDKAVKDVWYVCLEKEWVKKGNNPPQKGEIESLAAKMSDAQALALVKTSKGYKALPPSLRDDTKLLNILRSAQWN